MIKTKYIAYSITLVVLLAIMSTSALAQTGEVTGVVMDGQNGDFLHGATVQIKGTNTGQATDFDGEFTLRNLSVGNHILVVSYIGYRKTEVDVNIIARETTHLQIELDYAGYDGDEIIITAQAQGQVAAINEQLRSNTISNVVSRDRIRDLPDVNAAESIGRLPGVSILRSSGEASKVAIRGLSPKYNAVTVNGVKLPSSDSDRSVDLSLIPSNMLDGIDVTKALTADKDADAIGGTIDLRLRQAPTGLKVDAQIQGGYNHVQDYYGNNSLSGTISNRFFDDRFGAIVSFNNDNYDRSSDTYSGSYRRGEELEDGRVDIIPTSINVNENFQRRNRLGGSMVLDYSIPNGKVVGNVFVNQITSDQIYRTNSYFLDETIRNYNISSNESTRGILTSGLAADQDFGFLSYDVGASYTWARNDRPNNYSWGFREESAFSSDLDSVSALGPTHIPNAARNDLDNTDFYDLGISDNYALEEQVTIQGNVKAPFILSNLINGHVKAGGKFHGLRRMNDQGSASANVYHGGSMQPRDIIALGLPDLGLETGQMRIKMDPFLDNEYGRSTLLDGQYPIGYIADVDLLMGAMQAIQDANYFETSPPNMRGSDYDGIESLGAGYIMSEVNIGSKITFMPGVRYEQEYSRYNAYAYRNMGLQTVLNDTSASRGSSFILPMIHLQLKPLEWLSLRLAYTESLTRPNYNQYSPRYTINAWGNAVNTGNQDLKPAQATNYDASLSVYQNVVGLFTVSGFYKSIDDLIWNTSFDYLPGQTVMPNLVLPNLQGIPIISTSINNPYEAVFKGVELDWQTNFWYLPSVLKGLVLNVNYTRIVSETEYPRYQTRTVPIPVRPFTKIEFVDTSRVGRMPDQPAHIMNLTVGYDYKGFSTRLSFLYQANTLSSLGNVPETDHFTEDYFRIDALVRQRLFQNFQLYMNLNNINQRADRRYQSSIGAYPTRSEYYGFTMDLGIRYRF
ncbi:MAG: TonB-dependent receptor [Balneolales bacterium]